MWKAKLVCQLQMLLWSNLILSKKYLQIDFHQDFFLGLV